MAIISLPLELATCRLSELDLHIDFFLIYRFGSDKVKREFLAPSITGDRVSCLGVSEAGAGSDVASKVVIYTSLLLKSDITNEPNYHNDPKFLDRQVWADILDQDQTASQGSVWSGSILSASFGHITLPPRSNFRMIAAILWGVWIFRII